MELFRKKRRSPSAPELCRAERESDPVFTLPQSAEPFEYELFERLRYAVPVIDAAIMKIIRLTGGFHLISTEKRYQDDLDRFCNEVPVGLKNTSLGSFADSFLDSLLTYGSAVGEIVIDESSRTIAGLWNGDTAATSVTAGATPFDRRYSIRGSDGKYKAVKHPERIVYASLTGGRSLLRGLPALSSILLRIYQCIGQNFDRVGNVRYAVTYKPTDSSGDVMKSRERAMQIAREWSDGMSSARYGQVKDFVAVGDVDIKVIGAENQLISTEIPVRQLLEQIIAKLSIPPFLLGLTWSSTERMSSQQADILTSELEYYRRLLTPVLTAIGNAFLGTLGVSVGSAAECTVEWDTINLQDESALAQARLNNARAAEIEAKLNNITEV